MNFGPYRIVGLLGEGGMGVVRLAVDPAGRNVALKVIKPDLCAEAEVRGRFRFNTASSCRSAIRDADSGDSKWDSLGFRAARRLTAAGPS